MNFENIFKNIITTILGAIMMGFAFYGWYTDWLTDFQGIGAGVGGFALLFMRDTLPNHIGQLLKTLIDKIGTKKE